MSKLFMCIACTACLPAVAGGSEVHWPRARFTYWIGSPYLMLPGQHITHDISVCDTELFYQRVP
jgi:hypothetical protein